MDYLKRQPGDGGVKGHIHNPRQAGEAKPKKFLQAAINPEHEGYCTPMSKETCTPRRAALAKRLKPGGDLYKGKKK